MTGIDPGPDEARELLRRELLDPAYRDGDLLGRLLRRLQRLLDDVAAAAAGSPPVVAVAVALLVLAVLAGVALLVARTRRSRAGGVPDVSVHAGRSGQDADALRRGATERLAAGDVDGALVEGFRALARRAVEREALADLPDATAREVAVSLGALVPPHADDLHDAARDFGAVLYGGRPATAAQVERMLGLDRAVAGLPVGAAAGSAP